MTRIGYECPNCGEHHTRETEHPDLPFWFTRCPKFPALGWIRLERGEG